MDTKDRIISAAIDLFNERGYQVVTLKDVATSLGISRGNLAYHYKDKDLVLQAIASRMDKEIQVEMSRKKSFPAFANLRIEIESYYKLQSRYPFVFGNSVVLQHDAIMRVMHSWAQNTIKGNIVSFQYALEIGNLKEEAYDGQYYQLAINSWMVTYFWMTQQTVRQVESSENAEKMVWSTIVPHFTERGIREFSQYFGADFLKSFGPAILDISAADNLISEHNNEL